MASLGSRANASTGRAQSANACATHSHPHFSNSTADMASQQFDRADWTFPPLVLEVVDRVRAGAPPAEVNRAVRCVACAQSSSVTWTQGLERAGCARTCAGRAAPGGVRQGAAAVDDAAGRWPDAAGAGERAGAAGRGARPAKVRRVCAGETAVPDTNGDSGMRWAGAFGRVCVRACVCREQLARYATLPALSVSTAAPLSESTAMAQDP